MLKIKSNAKNEEDFEVESPEDLEFSFLDATSNLDNMQLAYAI